MLLVTLTTLAKLLLTVGAQLCPAPFNLEAGKCVFVSTAQSHSWCWANQQCQLIGGELINSYSSLQLLGSMPSFICTCHMWLGVSDLADERNVSRSGWQRVLSKGLVPTDGALWSSPNPDNKLQAQDCISTISNGLMADRVCSDLLGYACEFTGAAETPSNRATEAAWKRTPFKRTSYNPSSQYCFTDLQQVRSPMHCVAAAMREPGSRCRHVLYNSKLRTCRLLLFTDAQVEEEMETSADWVKFSLP